jgi:hypothetical protein
VSPDPPGNKITVWGGGTDPSSLTSFPGISKSDSRDSEVWGLSTGTRDGRDQGDIQGGSYSPALQDADQNEKWFDSPFCSSPLGVSSSLP